jgi:ClpP class serine protease
LDLFSEKDEKDYEIIERLLDDVYKSFHGHVMKNRATKLIKDPDYLNRIFNADIFSGEEAQKIGLTDHIGDYRTVLGQKFPGQEIKDYSVDTTSLYHAMKKGANSGNIGSLFNMIKDKILH